MFSLQCRSDWTICISLKYFDDKEYAQMTVTQYM